MGCSGCGSIVVVGDGGGGVCRSGGSIVVVGDGVGDVCSGGRWWGVVVVGV